MALNKLTCAPCQGGIPPLSREQAQNFLAQITNWQLSDEATLITCRYTFADFKSALAFVNHVGQLCEEQNHHPDITFGWGYVSVIFYTHKIKGLHENDFIMASKCDALYLAE